MSKERELLKKIWEDLDGDRDNYNSLCEEIEELLAQPEQESPTHEPLSDDEIRVGMGDEPPISRSGFVRGVRFAEKAHGIGGDDA